MLTTITLGTCISVQGEIVAHLPNGELLVRAGSRLFRGRPVRSRAAACPAAGAAA